MARKSRRATTLKPVGQPCPHSPQQLRTAAYVRLSSGNEEQGTLQTQAELIHQYIREHNDLSLSGTYTDNGFSGADFNRPGFQRLMNDVLNGTVQCIVVKDLSRFGRNFPETSYYIETLLPELNVRFIAVTDDFDSGRAPDGAGLILPIKNIVNAMYAKDFSKKAASCFEQHSKKGDAKIKNSTYGYLLDREKNTLIPDPETAPIVRIIFRWFLMGIGISEIAHRLDSLHIPTPAEYRARRDRWETFPQEGPWTYKCVRRILKNETYMGDRVYGKRRKMAYKNQPVKDMPPEEWVIHRSAQAALVPAPDFKKAQEMISAGREKYLKRRAASLEKKELYQDIFPQKVKCMECGRTMFYTRFSHSKYKEALHGAVYWCHDNYGRGNGCGQKVSEDYLKIVSMDQIRQLLQSMYSKKELELQMRHSRHSSLPQMKNRAKRLTWKAADTEIKISQLGEDFVSGVIAADEYREQKSAYALEKQRAQAELQAVEEQILQIGRQMKELSQWADSQEEYPHSKELCARLLNSLISEIQVGRSGAVGIQFQCADIFQEALRAEGTAED